MNKILAILVAFFKVMIGYTPRNRDDAVGVMFLKPKFLNLLGKKDKVLEDSIVQACHEDDYITYAVENLNFSNDEVFALPVFIKGNLVKDNLEFDLFLGDDEQGEFCGVWVLPKHEMRACLGVRELTERHEGYMIDRIRDELDLLTDCVNDWGLI